jgi:hypothetical protein
MKDHDSRLTTIFDYCKHLTTLSSAAIVVIATFLAKTPPTKPSVSAGYLISAIGFVVCIAAAVLGMVVLPGIDERNQHEPPMQFFIFSLLVAIVAFLVGMISLVFVIWAHIG